MGAELIVTGYTVKNITPDPEAIKAILDAITDEELLAAAPDLDENEYEYRDENTDYRAILGEGADIITAGWFRHSSGFNLLGDRTFVVAGGTSGGDEPFEGWSSLIAFINACIHWPALGEATGVVGWGIVLPE